MTPELKQACELIFQEHKISRAPIDWSKNTFHGRIAFHLSALAKQTLEKRNIICAVNGRKKPTTILNPFAASAENFEEAEEIILNKHPVIIAKQEKNQANYKLHQISSQQSDVPDENKMVRTFNRPDIVTSKVRWWPKPLYYFLWLLSAAIAGGLITYLLSLLV